MSIFKRKAVQIQQSPDEPDDLRIVDMPPGTRFIYLGRECVVIDYAPRWAGEHLGICGMEFHYADNRGIIQQGRIIPRNFVAFRANVEIIRDGEKSN